MVKELAMYYESIGLTLSKTKSVLLANREDAEIEVTIKGEQVKFKAKKREEAIRILGWWVDIDGNTQKAQRIAVDAYKAKVSFVARRCAFMKDKAMVMNMAVNKALEYVASFVQIEGKYIQEMRKWAREKLAWQGRKKVIGAGWQIFAEKEMGGLGVKDPGLVCEEASINTFLRSALEKEGTVFSLSFSPFLVRWCNWCPCIATHFFQSFIVSDSLY